MVLINLDRLYDETLYDFCGCFKQYALNRYLKRRFGDQDEYWAVMGTDEEKQSFNEHRHTFDAGASILEEIELYRRFCLELLFSPQDHAQFYMTLIMIARNLEQNNKTGTAIFATESVLGIAESLWDQMGKKYETKEELLARCRAKLTLHQKARVALPFLMLEGELLTLCRNGIAVTDRSNEGEGMFEYRVQTTTRRKPCANMIFYNAFIGYNQANLDEPKRALYANKAMFGKFQNISINDFIRNPLEIHTSFSEINTPLYTFKSPEPTDFPACKPEVPIFGSSVSKAVHNLRDHIFLTMWVNDNFVNQGPPIDLRKCRDREEVVYNTPPMVRGADGVMFFAAANQAFWNLGLEGLLNTRYVVDFKGKHLTRDRPRGCTVPTNVAQEMIAMDLELSKAGDAISPEQMLAVPLAAVTSPSTIAAAHKAIATKSILSGKRKRVEKSPTNTVRFTEKDQINLVPKNDPSRGGAVVKKSKRKKHEQDDPKGKEDNNKLAFVAAALLAFFGIFYWNP